VYVGDTTHGNSGTQTLTVNASSSFADVAFAFLNTTSGVTLPSNCTAVADPNTSTDPFSTAQASTDARVTWKLTGFVSTTDHARTRNTALGVLAGMSFEANNGTQPVFTVIGLPAGTYSVYIGGGDATSSTSNQYIVVKDGATAKLTIAGVSVAVGSSIDATGAVYTDANWPTSEAPVTGLTFSGGNITVVYGSPTAQTGNTNLSYVRFQQTA